MHCILYNMHCKKTIRHRWTYDGSFYPSSCREVPFDSYIPEIQDGGSFWRENIFNFNKKNYPPYIDVWWFILSVLMSGSVCDSVIPSIQDGGPFWRENIYKNPTLICIAKKLSITYGRMMAHSFRHGVGKSILIVSFQKSKMADHFGKKIYKQFHFNMHCKKVSTTCPDACSYILIVSFKKSKMADHFVGKSI